MEKMNDWEYGIHPAKRESAIRRVFRAFMDFYSLAKNTAYFLMPFYPLAELPEDIAKACTPISDKESRSGMISGSLVYAAAKRRLVDAVECEFIDLDAESFADFMCLAMSDIESEPLDKMRDIFEKYLEAAPDEEFYEAADELEVCMLFIKEDLFELVAKHTGRSGKPFRYECCFSDAPSDFVRK